MISRRALLTGFGLSMLVASTIGCGPSWIVVKAAAPNPLLGVKTFVVEPIHFDSLTVGNIPEAEFAAGKTPDQLASWQADKGGMNDAFMTRLADKADGYSVVQGPASDPSTFTVRAFVTHWQPGFYAGVSHMNSDAEMTMQIIGPAGVVDEIAMHVYVAASVVNQSTGGRIRSAGEKLGGVVAAYLASRVNP
jgi:hypothetical protein